jgi:hypothetical protein
MTRSAAFSEPGLTAGCAQLTLVSVIPRSSKNAQALASSLRRSRTLPQLPTRTESMNLTGEGRHTSGGNGGAGSCLETTAGGDT